MSEAFVYLWFDSKNRKFYLGKHKGTPDDGYTHSSTVMESFDAPPPHMKRRILAYGTDEEMCLLEHECLKNRKEKKWDRYYNLGVGSPWLDQNGENNPNYKHGLSSDPDWKKQIDKNYHLANREHRNKQIRDWRKSNIEYVRAYNRERNKKKYQSDPEYKQKQIDNVARNRKKRLEDPEYRMEYLRKARERDRKYRARKKAEKLAQQTGATLPL